MHNNMNNKAHMFLLKDVSFQFCLDKSYFFRSISLSFESGRLYFLCGKNGVGKSTLFRLMQGDVRQEEQVSGTVVVGDKSVDMSVDRSYGKYVRLVQQDVDMMLINPLTVKENLQCALLPSFPGMRTLPVIDKPEFLKMCGIDMNQQVASLSGGQRQLLAVIMALQKTTCVLLLDEPTAALDDENARMVMDFLKNIAQEQHMIVVIISHDAELIAQYSAAGQRVMVEKWGEVRRIFMG